MKIILIYLLLFSFWAELALGFKLTQIPGLSLANLCLYLLLIAWGYSIAIKKRIFEPNDVNKYIILLSFLVLTSILIKQLLGEIPIINMKHEMIVFKNWIDPFLFFFVIFSIIDTEKTLKASILGLILLLAVTAITTPLISIGVLNIGHTSRIAIFEGRASAFGGVNSFASYLVMFIPLVLTYFLFHKGISSKATSAVLLCFALIALITTGSRGGLMSLVVAIVVYLFFGHRQKIIRLPTMLGIIIAILIVGPISFMLAPSKSKDILTERLDPRALENDGIDGYTAGRTRVLRNGIQLFFDSPIYGHGHNSFYPLMQSRFHISAVAHNTYLSYLVEYGIIGLAAFLVVLIKIYLNAWKHLNKTINVWDKFFYISYIAGFCGYHFSLLALNEGEPRFIFWIYTALVLKFEKFSNC